MALGTNRWFTNSKCSNMCSRRHGIIHFCYRITQCPVITNIIGYIIMYQRRTGLYSFGCIYHAGQFFIFYVTASAASTACSFDSAITMATASPTCLALSATSSGCFGSFMVSPFLKFTCQPQGTPFTAATSAPV